LNVERSPIFQQWCCLLPSFIVSFPLNEAEHGEYDSMTEANEPVKSELPTPDSEQLELKLPDESSAPKDIALWAGVLALLTLIAFWPATTGSFIWRDDATVDNKQLLIAPTALSQSWFGRWQSSQVFDRPIYQPVTDTAYWLEYRLGGHNEQGIPTSTSFHIASLIFEATAAILLWLILRELLIPGAWLIAAIFAVHPIHAEPVSWISEQGTVLSGALFLGSVYSYLMFVKSREQNAADLAAGGAGVDPAQTWGLYAGSAALCLMAILSQPSALVLPAVIALLIWWKKRYVPTDGLLLLPLLVIGLAFWFGNVDLHKKPSESLLLHASIIQQVTTIGHAFGNLVFHLILPFRFSVLYLHGDQSGLFVLLAALPFAVLAVLYVFRDRFGTGLAVAIAIVVMLVCFSVNWFNPSRLSYVTDCTSYLAIVPVLAVIVLFISRVRLPGPYPQTLVGLCTAILIIFGALTLRRTYAFESSIALWRDALKKDPNSSFAEASLAEQLRLQAIDDAQTPDNDAMNSDLAEAIEHAESALRLDPANGPAQRTWANVLVSQGDIAKAIPHFELAGELEPKNSKLLDEYGNALIALGRFKEARSPLDQALALDTNVTEPHELLGDAYAGLKDLRRAVAEEDAALAINAGDLVARQKRAEFEARDGRFVEAITDYTAIMQVDKAHMNNPDLYAAIAKIRDQQGEYQMAVDWLKPAVQLAQDNADLKKQLDTETAKAAHAAATRAATMPSTTRSSK
jgi:protein O-mannosyl-transferase